jgi:hypothetical protein
MIDVSDGLAQDLGHILKASKVGARLQLEQIPIDQSLKIIEQQAWQYAFAGGDDYELCFTISPQNFEKLSRQQLDVPLTIIGKITQQTGLLFEYMGENYPLQFMDTNTLHKPPIHFKQMTWFDRCIVFCGLDLVLVSVLKHQEHLVLHLHCFLPIWLYLGFNLSLSQFSSCLWWAFIFVVKLQKDQCT